MPLELDLTSVVVLGAWNPAIINPAWLGRYKIVEEVPESLAMEFYTGGRRFRFSLGELDWRVDDSRLEIVSRDGRDCGSCAARILDLLPHTPIEAVGANFAFRCPREEWPADLLPRLGDVGPPGESEAGDLQQVEWVGTYALSEEGRLQVRVAARSADGIVAAFNVHRNVADAEQAAKVAGAWAKDRDIVLDQLKSLFGLDYSWPAQQP